MREPTTNEPTKEALVEEQTRVQAVGSWSECSSPGCDTRCPGLRCREHERGTSGVGSGAADLDSTQTISDTGIVAIAVAGTGIVVLETYTDAYDPTFEECDEQYGEDGWVFVEEPDPSWYVEFVPGGIGETECVDVNSERADDCVIIPSVIADYNARCEAQR